MSKGHRPNYRLGVLHKDSEKKAIVGAAWNNPDGSISISLHPCVVLNGNDNITLRLFPNDNIQTPAPQGPTTSMAERIAKKVKDETDDDVPF